MGKIAVFLVVLFVAAFFANHFQVVSIPWLDLPQVPTYAGNAQNTDEQLKKIDE